MTVSSISLLVLAPVFLVIGLLVKRDSRGPVFYCGGRVGRGGKAFRIYKFRTMVADADKRGPGITARNDSRVTRLGRVLRRTKLDELPQLINVVRGEMSLVGPRPEIREMVEAYPPLFRRLLALRPGITSPASLAYRNEEAILGDDASTYAQTILPKKLALDLRYLYRHNLVIDIGLIVRTVAVVFGGDSLIVRWIARSIRRHVPWILLDAPVIILAFYAALFLRLLDFPASEVSGYLRTLTLSMPVLVLVFLLMNSVWGLHRRIWRYATAADVRPIVGAGLTATVLTVVGDLVSGAEGTRLLPLGVLVLGGFFSLCGLVLIRYRSRLLRGLSPKSRSTRSEGTRAVIYGAGDAGQHLAFRLLTHEAGDAYELVGFLDDDRRKRGQRIHGIQVLGSRRELPGIVSSREIDLVIIAINNIRGEDLREILTAAQQTRAQIRIIPGLFEVVENPKVAPLLREVRVEDMLGRQPVQLDRDACERVLRGKVVLITGGCGSVGSELCRQVAQFHPKHLVVLDNNETGLYDLEVALRAKFHDLHVSIVIADVTDWTRMEGAFAEILPEVIFHAAAYKHVPLMERFPTEAVRVNLGGTRTALDMARRFHAKYFVFVSTDKAVAPHSVMGATKRIAERLVMEAGADVSENPMRCTVVRFGNVLGSRGSVVPTFARQIELGGPVTVTHADMTRYFMEISEAAGLIIQAASFTQGGDIFMLDMGERIRVDDLARKMIRMRGLRPEIDIPIVYTGVRPGEKLHEELVFPEEGREPTAHPLVHRVKSSVPMSENGHLREGLDRLLELAKNGAKEALVPELMRLAGGTNGNGPIHQTVPTQGAAVSAE